MMTVVGHDAEEFVPRFPECQGGSHSWDWAAAERVDLHSKTEVGRWVRCSACGARKLQSINKRTGYIADTDYVYPNDYLRNGRIGPTRAEIRADHLDTLPPADPGEVWMLVRRRR